MNTFSLKVIACDRVFFDGRCKQVILPLEDGQKAIQAHHENMAFAVEVGENPGSRRKMATGSTVLPEPVLRRS